MNDINYNVTLVHLLNNYSGSPNVLKTVINGLKSNGYKVNLITSLNNEGFLTSVDCDSKINVPYSFKTNVLLRFLLFVRFQILSAYYVLKSDINGFIYINTVQPFLPAIVAFLRGQKVVYHLHEAYPVKSMFQKFLFAVLNFTSTQIICVSEYVKESLDEKVKCKSKVVYNSLDDSFLTKVKYDLKERKRNHILMISSARQYKGIFEFCKLAQVLPQFKFSLVCDIDEVEIYPLFSSYLDLKNLKIYSRQNDVHPFYAQADIIVNLSNPLLIIETFGLTILEGMKYALPAIVPKVGGISELVTDAENGYHVDVNEFSELKIKIETILNNNDLYEKMSKAALTQSTWYSNKNQTIKIIDILMSLKNNVDKY